MLRTLEVATDNQGRDMAALHNHLSRRRVDLEFRLEGRIDVAGR